MSATEPSSSSRLSWSRRHSRRSRAGHPRGVEGLHEAQGLLHLLHREGPHVGDLLEARAQEPVFLEVVDHRFADLEQHLVGGVHLQLPEQVIVEVRGHGERVLEGRRFDARRRSACRRSKPAPSPAYSSKNLSSSMSARGSSRSLRSSAVSWMHLLLGAGLLDRRLLQQGVLRDLLLEDLGQLQGGEGQELDGLLERGGEDQPLGEAGVQPQLLLHGQGSGPATGVRPSPRATRPGERPRRGTRAAPPRRRRELAACLPGTHHRPSEYRPDPLFSRSRARCGR